MSAKKGNKCAMKGDNIMTSNIHLRITKEEKQAFRQRCKDKGESMTEALMKMIRKYIK
jgi:uncharacterized protein YllA (UPF0747 family)